MRAFKALFGRVISISENKNNKKYFKYSREMQTNTSSHHLGLKHVHRFVLQSIF